MKRITVLLLIMIMVLTSAGSAFAVDNAAVLPIEARLYTGGDEPLISVAVPESITARSTLADPTVLEYDTITIENFASSVQIDSMSVTPESGYTLLADDSDFSIAGKSFSMVAKFGDTGTEYDLAKGEAEGECEPKCVVYRDSSLDIDLSGHFSPTQEAVNAKGATLTLTISARSALVKVTGQNLTFQVGSLNFTEQNGTLEYSTDNGVTWNEYSNIQDGYYYYYGNEQNPNPNTVVNASSGTLYLRGSGIEAFYVQDPTGSAGDAGLRFIFGGSDIQLSGNIEALRDWESVDRGELPAKADCAFYRLFAENTGITDASALVLPQTDLSDTEKYYMYMFSGCKALEKAPALPATTLADCCYYGMFSDCEALEKAPALPATTLAGICYGSMFYGCTTLEEAPALPATTLEAECYMCMFQDCTSLKTVPELPATTLADYCYGSMFSGCKALEKAPALPTTTLAESCYAFMFYGCTTLEEAPALPATTLKSNCYINMFQDCTSLKTVPELPATTLMGFCYHRMFKGCTSLKLSETQTGEYKNAYRIPTSGTGTEGSYALNGMFANTGGSFTGTPAINTTYYTSNTIVG